jgi:hypothetical protein
MPIVGDLALPAHGLEHAEVRLMPDEVEPAPSARCVRQRSPSSAAVFLMANICTTQPSWRKCPVRGTTTRSAPSGLDVSVVATICARAGTRRDHRRRTGVAPQHGRRASV